MSHTHAEDCSDFLDRIVYLIDNELDQDDIAVVRAHLEGCGPCLERYDVQRTVKTLVARSCTETAPNGLMERVRLSIQQVSVTIRESGT